jgi:hypothetical protein
VPEPQDGAQPCQQYPEQAARGRPRPGHGSRPPGRPGWLARRRAGADPRGGPGGCSSLWPALTSAGSTRHRRNGAEMAASMRRLAKRPVSSGIGQRHVARNDVAARPSAWDYVGGCRRSSLGEMPSARARTRTVLGRAGVPNTSRRCSVVLFSSARAASSRRLKLW